jgi:hypothetical protein
MKKISTAQETKVVAMIARGDTYPTIVDKLAEDGIEISTSTITRIKDRNSEALAFMKNTMLEQQASTASRILHRSREIIESRLSDDDKYWEIIKELNEKLESGEIDEKQYWTMRPTAPSLSLRDLTSVSKEMFNQSQIEAGKPTAITDNPAQAKENLKVLLDAINKGSDEDIAKAIFLDA